MRNKVALMSFFVILILAAGCNQETSPKKESFVGGTEALSLSFIEGSPPSEVTDRIEGETGFPFGVTLVMENVGEYKIEPTQKMLITLSGFFPGDFSIQDPDNQLSITYPGQKDGAFDGVKKDSEGNPIRGDTAYIRFPKNTELDFLYRQPIAVSTPFPFRAEVCYPYETKVISELCLMDDFTSNDDQPVCNPEGNMKVSNSGGPIHVSSVTQSVAGRNKILIRFDVKQVGDSDLFYYEGVNSGCEYTPGNRNKNRVLVEVDTGLQGLNCNLIGGGGIGAASKATLWSGDLIISSDESVTFTCIQTLEEKDRRDGIKTFNTYITYMARDTISTDVLVKHSLS